MTPRFYDAPDPRDIRGATLVQLVDRLTKDVERQIGRTLADNALLRLQLEDFALMDREWHLLPDGERWVGWDPEWMREPLGPEAAASSPVYDEALTVPFAARRVGVWPNRLYRAIRRGKLTVVHVPGQVTPHVRMSEVDRWRKTQ